jgi:hypothetical protein
VAHANAGTRTFGTLTTVGPVEDLFAHQRLKVNALTLVNENRKSRFGAAGG